jgi:hypothetical protein
MSSEPAKPAPSPLRTRSVIARDANGQPRTYRLSPQPAQQAAYRRLALAILGLDVAALADELRTARRFAHVLPHAA